jgi:alkanesulfonate monooxygenase SsuD/methylene tetrahydromethanopterin reductase-like flavin-dependent oxidoreductase (luciferase family)
VDHLRRIVEELDRLLGSADHLPQPVQKRVPLMIGGNGRRMMGLTAEHADIAAFTGARLVPGSATGRLSPVAPTELEESVARYRRLAEGRAEPAELNLLIQLVAVTDDRASAVRPLAERVPDTTVEQALRLPILLVGTVAEIVAQVRAQRERYGFSYLTVLEPYMEEFAPVVAELRGR